MNGILESWTRNPERKISSHKFSNLVPQIIEQYLAVPKITNLLEFSFLLNNVISIQTQGWRSLHYRGENKRFQHPCRSTYFRFNETLNKKQEIEEVNDFIKTKLGKDTQEKLLNSNLNQDHYYLWFLTQHHSEEGNDFRGSGFQTRLLDVSKNPYVALFFSCFSNEKDNNKDGYVYIFYDLINTAISLRPAGYGPHDKLSQFEKNPYKTYMKYIEDPQEQFEIDRLISIDWHRLPEAYDLVKRVVAQSGEFVVQKSRDKGTGTWEFIIDGNSKQKILDDLSKYLNINSQTLLLDF